MSQCCRIWVFSKQVRSARHIRDFFDKQTKTTSNILLVPLPATPKTLEPVGASTPSTATTKNRVTKRQANSKLSNYTHPTTSAEPENLQDVVLGYIVSTGTGTVHQDQYKCSSPSCQRATFGRLAELKRHHASKHGTSGVRRPQYWCPIDGCKSNSVSRNDCHSVLSVVGIRADTCEVIGVRGSREMRFRGKTR
jgi:hypothetical protein